MANPMSAEAGREAVPFDLDGRPDAREIASAAAIASIEAASQRATGKIELRVLDGVSAGHRLAWADADALVVATRGPGFDWSTVAQSRDGAAASVPTVGDPDLVLLDIGAPTRVVMSRHLFHASVTVLDGEVRVGERTVGRGERIVLSMYSRLRIGDSTLAFGQNLLGSWPAPAPTVRETGPEGETRDGLPIAPTPSPVPTERRPARPAAHGAQPSATSEDAAPLARPAVGSAVRSGVHAGALFTPEDRPTPASVANPGRSAGRRALWTAAGLGLTLACAAVIWFEVADPGLQEVPDPAAALRADLDAGPFRDLTLELREGGRWHLRGRVGSVADRAALERLLAGRGLDVEAGIIVDDVIAPSAGEPGRVVVESVDGPNDAGGVDAPVATASSAPERHAPDIEAKDRVPGASELIAPIEPVQIPALSLRLELSTGARGLLPGESLSLRVRPSRAGHVTCFMQEDTRQVLRIFPNRFQTDSRVGPAGIELPGDVPFEIRMNMNRQTESIACFVTEQDIVARLPGSPAAFDLTPLPVSGLGEIEAAIARLTDGVVAHQTVAMRPL